MAATLRDVVSKYSQPSLCLETRDLEKVHRATEVLRQGLRQQFLGKLQTHQNRAVLLQYGSDCTPLTTKERFDHRIQEVSVTRSGHKSSEFLIQKLFLDTLDSPPLTIVEVPIPMASKTAYAHFGARRQLLKTGRELGHQGLLVEFHKYDRAIMSALKRLHEQFSIIIEEQQEDELGIGKAYQLQLTHWLLCEGCSAHDVHNDLKWALLCTIQATRRSCAQLF